MAVLPGFRIIQVSVQRFHCIHTAQTMTFSKHIEAATEMNVGKSVDFNEASERGRFKQNKKTLRQRFLVTKAYLSDMALQALFAIRT